jgi:hypothetical protein
MAKKTRKPAAKRKPDKRALVFQLGEISSLPNFVRVCREVAKCPARHRPVEEYLRWTFMIVHDRWADELELPPHDPALHKEADGDYVPGFASGLFDLLEVLPGFYDVVPPTKGQANYFVEDHVELSVAEIADHLRGRGFEIMSAAELLATHEPGDHDPTSGLADALSVLVHRAELRAGADDPSERAEVERAIQRSLKLVRSTFGLKFPRDV